MAARSAVSTAVAVTTAQEATAAPVERPAARVAREGAKLVAGMVEAGSVAAAEAGGLARAEERWARVVVSLVVRSVEAAKEVALRAATPEAAGLVVQVATQETLAVVDLAAAAAAATATAMVVAASAAAAKAAAAGREATEAAETVPTPRSSNSHRILAGRSYTATESWERNGCSKHRRCRSSYMRPARCCTETGSSGRNSCTLAVEVRVDWVADLGMVEEATATVAVAVVRVAVPAVALAAAVVRGRCWRPWSRTLPSLIGRPSRPSTK